MSTQDIRKTDRMRLKALSSHDFRMFGLHQVGYIKPGAEQGVVVHAADGSKLATLASSDEAFRLAFEKDLSLVRLQ